jgi:hypothetical protein
MSTFNIIIDFYHPDAISNIIRYARIDNTVTPTYTTVTGITNSPYIIENVNQGQFRIYIKPIYSDGRICSETVKDTDACTGVTALSAVLDGGGDFVISYTAEVSVPIVQVNISYPNGGFSSQQYVNAGTDITITPPSGVYGTFFITMQPVCDADTGWLGVASAPVSVEIPDPSP